LGAQLFEPAAVGVEIALQGQDSDFHGGRLWSPTGYGLILADAFTVEIGLEPKAPLLAQNTRKWGTLVYFRIASRATDGYASGRLRGLPGDYDID
jgi:hypothetical protein